MGKIVPVILCGGAGTRLWPLSRENFPKLFVHLFGENTGASSVDHRYLQGRLDDQSATLNSGAWRETPNLAEGFG